MKIMVWDCRGALSPNFCKIIIDMMKDSNLDILVVTKTRVNGDRAKEITNKLPFDGAVHTDTIGYVGGLWLLWNSAVVEVKSIATTK